MITVETSATQGVFSRGLLISRTWTKFYCGMRTQTLPGHRSLNGRAAGENVSQHDREHKEVSQEGDLRDCFYGEQREGCAETRKLERELVERWCFERAVQHFL